MSQLCSLPAVSPFCIDCPTESAALSVMTLSINSFLTHDTLKMFSYSRYDTPHDVTLHCGCGVV